MYVNVTIFTLIVLLLHLKHAQPHVNSCNRAQETINALSGERSYVHPGEHLPSVELEPALAALASPWLGLSAKRFLIAQTAHVSIKQYLARVVSHSAAVLRMRNLVYFWNYCEPRRRVLSIWAVTAALELNERKLDCKDICANISDFRIDCYICNDASRSSVGPFIPIDATEGSRQVYGTSSFRARFQAQQLQYLLDRGLLSTIPFSDHVSELVDAATSLRDLVDANGASTEGASTAEATASRAAAEYQCFVIADVHAHFPLPSSFGRVAHLRAPSDALFLTPMLAATASCNFVPEGTIHEELFGWTAAQAAYATSSSAHGAGIAVIDSVLRQVLFV